MTDNDLFNPADDKSELFSQTQDVEPDKDYVTELVGDDKKFKDVQALARGKVASDAHIARIERENAELRQELNQRLNLEEFYEKVKAAAPSPGTPAQPQSEERERNEISLEQVGSLVDQRMQKQAAEMQQRANLQYVESELAKRLGPNYQAIMRERAKDLGENTNDLTALAATKPKVFLELMVPKGGSVHVPAAPRSAVDAAKSPSQPSGTRNQSYYAKLKQTDPKVYWDRKTQSQMHKDAQALGENFFQ